MPSTRVTNFAAAAKHRINEQSLFIKHSQGVYFSTQNTRDLVERHSYRTPPPFQVYRNILLQKHYETIDSKFVGTEISNFKTVFYCYLYLTQYVHLIHIFPIFLFVSKIFPCRVLLDRSSPVHNLEFSHPKKELESLVSGKVYFLTMRNDGLI